MSPSSLIQFSLPISTQAFIEQFWMDQSFYNDFLEGRLQNIHVKIGPWQDSQDFSFDQSSSKIILNRIVQSEHPMDEGYSYLRGLGMIPPYAQSTREQTLEQQVAPLDYQVVDSASSSSPTHLISEKATFSGIPFSDKFTIHTQWKISSIAEEKTQVEVEVDVKFSKPLFLSPLIVRNTKQELKQVLLKWSDHANKLLVNRKANGSGFMNNLLAKARAAGKGGEQ